VRRKCLIITKKREKRWSVGKPRERWLDDVENDLKKQTKAGKKIYKDKNA
jgi:hypothetical protein